MRALIRARPGGLEQDGLWRPCVATPRRCRGGSPAGRVEAARGPTPNDVEDVLYRIAQEALHNVVKHAGAKTVRLVLGRIDSTVRLAVMDDGTGFDATAIPPGHLGLAGMRARAEKIGGRLTVDSRSGQGTTIEAVVPAAERPAEGAADAVDSVVPNAS
jgi:nitrate/nitrite-specific signal transduction histidine kinase